MNKKGITPVIAIVLLLMMTVSSAAAAYYWMTTIQANLQQQAQGAISSTGLGGGYQITALSGGITCNATDDTIQVFITNTGANTIPSGRWYAFVKDSVGASIGTWENSSVPQLGSGNTMNINFTTSSGDLQTSTQYTVQINSPKGTTATTACTGAS